MSSKVSSVKDFFSDSSKYLKENYNILVRKQIVRTLLPDVKDARILDIGCGNGIVSLQFLSESNRVTLLDLSEEMLENARKNTPPECQDAVRYINANFVQYPTDETFDVLICLGVLAHVDDVEEAIKKISSLVRPNGRCILQFTDADTLAGKLLYYNSALRHRFARGSSYSTNRTRGSDILSLCAKHQLQCVARRQYMIGPVGLRRLLRRSIYRLNQFLFTKPRLTRCFAETLVLFQKESSSNREVTS